MHSVLYISYDGMMEPLGQSQVLAYLRPLARTHRIVLLSYEKPEDWEQHDRRTALHRTLREEGIRWYPLRYHKQPTAPATAWDVLVGVFRGVRLVQRYGIQLVHARSYVAALIGWMLKRLLGVRLLFDMRGFWADERLEGGQWTRHAPMYRLAKYFERRFLRESDAIVTLTHAAREVLPDLAGSHPLPPVAVIPTCTDLQRFRAKGGRREPALFGYVGSVGTVYRFDCVAYVFRQLLKRFPEARFLVLNRKQQDLVRETLAAYGVPLDRVTVQGVPFDEVPAYIARMQAGVFFYEPSFSRRATAPTRLGELLACGVPVFCNAGIGDVETLVKRHNVGVVSPGLDPESLQRGTDALCTLLQDTTLSARCVATARRYFALEQGVAAYQKLYTSLCASSS